MMRRLVLTLGALVLIGCGSDDEPPLGPPARYRIPGCEAYDTAPCDIRVESCQVKLMQIAVCLRQDAPADLPPVSVLTEEELAALMRAEAAGSDPVPNRHEFETAFALFGLVAPGAFESEAMIDSLVKGLNGLYRDDHKDVIIVDHGDGADPAAASDDLVHEFVHALQDREVDLATWLGGAPTYDAVLALKSVVEGEARFHQLRYRAPMLGIDPRSVDWPRTFQNGVEASESWVPEQDSPLLAASRSFPYTWGARLTAFDWERTGHAGVLDRFSDPPVTTHALMASIEAVVADDFTALVAEPPVPPAGWLSVGSDALGALGTFLLLAREVPPQPARDLALAWRGDRFDVFLSEPDASGTTVEVVAWAMDFVDEASAREAETRLVLPAAAEARVTGSRLTIAASDRATDLGWALPTE